MTGEKGNKKYGLMEVVKVSETKNGQFRITLKKRIAQELNIRGTDYLVFLKNDRGEIVVKKLKLKDMSFEE
ncbi:MAG: hypothetical protein J7L63_01115 [Thermoplasmata archaeon]|nr:hypothetical protein [Thermoplasmata archaeon]